MAGSARRMSLVSSRLPVIAVVWTGLSLTVATAFAQSPPVRGGASGELRTPSGFSPIDLHHSSANAPGPSRSQTAQLNQHSSAASKTPIRRDSAAGEDENPARTGMNSPWTTLCALGAVLIGVVAATRLLRRSAGRRGDSVSPHLFDVLSGRRLDGQSSIHLVRIGRRIVAVGTSPAGVQPLTVIDDPLDVEELLCGGTAARSNAAGDAVTPLFGGTRAIRRGNDHTASGQPVGSGSQVLRRKAAVLVPPAEEADA